MSIMALMSMEPVVFLIVFFLVIMITIIVLGVLTHIMIVRYIYRDAKRNENPRALLWASVVCFTSIIGILLYYMLKEDEPNVINKDKEVI